MQTANEMKSAVNNIRYYNQKIKELAKKQFDIDCAQGDRIGINAQPGSIRFESLGAIISACSQLGIYCDNIENNLNTATKQDKLLYIEEKDEG